jgi:hypothetical protein
MQYSLLFHCNNGYMNAPQRYIIRTLPVLQSFVRGLLAVEMGGCIYSHYTNNSLRRVTSIWAIVVSFLHLICYAHQQYPRKMP